MNKYILRYVKYECKDTGLVGPAEQGESGAWPAVYRQEQGGTLEWVADFTDARAAKRAVAVLNEVLS